MEKLNAIEKNMLYNLVYWKIESLKEEIEKEDYPKLKERWKEQIEEYTKILQKMD